MNSIGAAALTSWTINPLAVSLLIVVAVVYVRGWLRGRRLVRGEYDVERLTAFLAGLVLLFVATESPLDAFDHFFLAAHMAQHLLLMMFVPPLILFGHPTLPLLRGLPKSFCERRLGSVHKLAAAPARIAFPGCAASSVAIVRVQHDFLAPAGVL